MQKVLIVAVLLSSASIWAQETASLPGQQTNAWLELQTSGNAASPHIQSDTLATREKSATRWSKTYEFPIKESYYGDSFKPGD